MFGRTVLLLSTYESTNTHADFILDTNNHYFAMVITYFMASVPLFPIYAKLTNALEGIFILDT